MLSKSSKYALKAILYLAVNSSADKKIMVKNISAPINVPQAYIAKLLQELSKHNIVSSARGPNGGFYMSDENKKTTLVEVINIIDGEDRLNSCLLSLHNCNDDKPCPLHHLAGPYRSAFIDNMKRNTINDMVSDIENEHSFLPL